VGLRDIVPLSMQRAWITTAGQDRRSFFSRWSTKILHRETISRSMQMSTTLSQPLNGLDPAQLLD
jgi:hypothetical protein